MVTLYKFIYHLIFSFTFCCITLACFLCRTLVGCLLETSLYVTAHKKVPITTHAFTINHGTENCWITQWYMTWYFWKYALYMYYWKIMCKQHLASEIVINIQSSIIVHFVVTMNWLNSDSVWLTMMMRNGLKYKRGILMLVFDHNRIQCILCFDTRTHIFS